MDGAQSCAVERTGAADEAQPRAGVGHRTHQLLPFVFLAFPRFSNFPLCCRNPSVESRKSRSMKVSTFIAHQRRIKSQREITVPDRNGCVRNAWNKVGRIYWGPRHATSSRSARAGLQEGNNDKLRAAAADVGLNCAYQLRYRG